MRLFRYYLAVNRDGETGRGVTLTRQHVKGGTGPLPKSNPVPPALFLLPPPFSSNLSALSFVIFLPHFDPTISALPLQPEFPAGRKIQGEVYG